MKRVLVSLTAAVAFALAMTTAASAANSSQVYFTTGATRSYFTYLKICGYNQNDSYTCWSRNFPGISSYGLSNWWWKLDRGIRLNFHLIGYGDRSCYIQRSGYGNPTWLYVYYEGDNRCTFR